MTETNEDDSSYEPYETQQRAQPFSSLSSSLLPPNPAILAQLAPSWGASLAWNNGQSESGFPYFMQDALGSRYPLEEQQDPYGDDFYSQNATPQVIQAEDGSQYFSRGTSSERSDVFQSHGEVPSLCM
jgi:hypothetical protein